MIAIKDQVELAKTTGLSTVSAAQLTDFEQRYQTLVEQGLKANPPPAFQQCPETRSFPLFE